MGVWRRGKKNARSGPARVDLNQSEIVAAFEKLGAKVILTDGVGNGMFDLIVGVFGKLHLVEVKNPKTAYGRKGYNKNQLEFAEAYKGYSLHMVRTCEEVAGLVARWREESFLAGSPRSLNETTGARE